MSTDERAELEVQLVLQIDCIIDNFIYSSFSEEDVQILTQTITKLLNFTELKQYILDTLYDKIREAANIIKPHDQVRSATFKQLLRVVLKIQDKDLIDTIETFFIKEKKIDYFLSLLELKIELGQDIVSIEKLFLSSITNYFSGETGLKYIEKFLKIINKDKSYLTRTLMNPKIVDGSLNKYVMISSNYDVPGLRDHIVPILSQEFNGSRSRYITLVGIILTHHTEFTKTLLSNSLWNYAIFADYVIHYHSQSTMLVANYCEYLAKHEFKEFELFEDRLLEVSSASNIITYARYVLDSNKRKILKRLVFLKSEDDINEKHLVDFISYFPEYKHLLPML